MCIVTRAVLPEADLLRFVAAPDGGVAPDLKAKLPGRGVWVSLDRRRVAEATSRNLFARALKLPVRPDPGLADLVAAQLRQAALGRLGLARKAGQVVAGFAKTEAAVAGGRILALILAAEAAEDSRRKMLAALRRRFGEAPPVPVLRRFGAAELGLALGRADVIHAAVLHGAAGQSFVAAAGRLARYEDPQPDASPAPHEPEIDDARDDG